MRVTLHCAIVGFVLLGTIASAQPTSSPSDRWDNRYDREMYIYGKEPIQFLRDRVAGLGGGKALCLAAGEGRNAVYLAQQGFDVTAVDISGVGLRKAAQLAAEQGVTLTTLVADLTTFDLGESRWDLITAIYYYQPDLFPKIQKALRPGGRFLLETFSIDNPEIAPFGPKNPDYLARPNELPSLLPNLRLRFYEDAVIDLHDGMHEGKGAIIRLIAQKPPE
jgi:SAM-dependent methyltransferase